MKKRTKHVLATVLIMASAPLARCAADISWEKLPNGVEGKLATFEGVGGVPIAGYVRKPEGAGPFPLVIVLHGGAPTAKAVQNDDAQVRRELETKEAARASHVLGHATHPPLAEFLAAGFAVYTIDFRPNPRYMIDPLEWDDTVIAYRQARAFPFIDPQRIAMLGGSHGGHVTGRMLTRVDLCCAVLCAPAGLDLIALATLAEKGSPIGGNQRLVREMEQRSGAKMAEIAKDPARYSYTSLLTEAPRVHCPVLMISGRNDPNAPLPVMDMYMEKLRAWSVETDEYHPDNGPHGFYFALPAAIPETAESTRRAVAFLKKQFETVR